MIHLLLLLTLLWLLVALLPHSARRKSYKGSTTAAVSCTTKENLSPCLDPICTTAALFKKKIVETKKNCDDTTKSSCTVTKKKKHNLAEKLLKSIYCNQQIILGISMSDLIADIHFFTQEIADAIAVRLEEIGRRYNQGIATGFELIEKVACKARSVAVCDPEKGPCVFDILDRLFREVITLDVSSLIGTTITDTSTVADAATWREIQVRDHIELLVKRTMDQLKQLETNCVVVV